MWWFLRISANSDDYFGGTDTYTRYTIETNDSRPIVPVIGNWSGLDLYLNGYDRANNKGISAFISTDLIGNSYYVENTKFE